MMKRLLFCALSALFAFSANAVEVGNYVYTPGGRYLLTGATSIDLSINDEFEGWTSISDDALMDIFTVADGYVSAVAAANTKGLYKSFSVDDNDKTYVLVFSAKANEDTRAYSFTPKYLGAAGDFISHLNVYATASGEYVNTATAAAAEGTVSAQADLGLGFQLTSEYQTYATALTNGGSDQKWFIEISQLLGGISIGQIQVFEAQKVFDNRFVQNKIDYLNAIINVYDWAGMEKTAEEQNVWDGFKGLPEELKDMADNTTVEAGTAKIEEVDGKIATFFSTFFGDYAGDQGIKLENGGTVSKGTGAVAGWATTQRWWHTNKAANLYWGNYAYTYANSDVITQTKSLAAGSYIFAADAFMDAMGKKGTILNHSYGYYSADTRSAVCRGELTLSILDGSDVKFAGQTIALDNQTYLTGVVAFTIPEGQEGDYTFQINGHDKYDGIQGIGGNGNLKDLRIFFKAAGKYNAKQLAYIEKVRTQINALRGAYDNSVSYYTDPESKYYWYKWAVKDTADTYAPYLEFYENLTDDDIINGYEDPLSKAAKEAAAAEGADVSNWDCETSYAKYINEITEKYFEEDTETGEMVEKERTRIEVNAIDTIMNRAVRPMLRLNERFLSFNQVLFDMLGAIDKAKVILDTRVFSGRIAYGTLEGAVGDAEAMFAEYKEDPGTVEDLVETYIPAVQEITNSMNETMTNFYQSGYNAGEEPTLIRSFDFEDATAFVLDDPETNPGTGSYTDATGVMTFGNLETAGTDGVYYSNGFFTDGSWTNQGMLRVGSGNGTVELGGDDIVSGTDALHVSFDFYYGNLSGKEAGVYMQDSEGNKVAGLMVNRYNGTTSYNPFGINLGDISGVGSSSASNVAIAAESNKTHFDYYIDYGTKTMFVVVNNTTQKAVNKRYDVDMENQNPVTTLIINSNYNNSARRCWVDNILIEKIPLAAPADYYYKALGRLIDDATKYKATRTYEVVVAELQKAIDAATNVYNTVGVTEEACKTAAEELQVALDAAKVTYPVGDVNSDDVVNGTDIQAVINFILAGEFDKKADVNEDGEVNGTDIQAIINIILGAN